MAYRAGVVGASGYTGAELLRLLAGHPEIDVVHVTADANAGRRSASSPVAGAAYGGLQFAPLEPPNLAGLDVVFLALPHGESQRRCGVWSTRSRTWSTSVPTSGCPAGVRAVVRRDPRDARAHRPLLVRARRALPATVASAVHVANPGCYPPRVARARAVVAGRLVEPSGIVVDPCRACPGGATREDHEPVQRGRRRRLGVLAAHASPHGRDGAGARGTSRTGMCPCCSPRTSCQ